MSASRHGWLGDVWRRDPTMAPTPKVVPDRVGG